MTPPAGDDGIRRGRLRKARTFFEAAHNLASLGEPPEPDAVVALYVQSGIAAADAICLARLGRHAKGADHKQAVPLLEQAAGAAVAKHLRSLLAMKNEAEYGYSLLGSHSVLQAERAARALVDLAALEAR